MKELKKMTSEFRDISTNIDDNLKYIKNVSSFDFENGYPANRFWTFDFIDAISDYINFNDIKTIFDIGSRDGYQSLEFRKWFPDAKIVAFEANPNQIGECLKVVQNQNIQVISKAIGNYNGKVKFNICSNNVGASSLLKVSDHPRSSSWCQSEIEVDMVRLEDWCEENEIEHVDLLWVDVQGAEKIVFEGCDKILNNVKAICTEVNISNMYNNSILKNELDEYLNDRGFLELSIFHLNNSDIKSLDEISQSIGECDVVYINKKILKSL